jgi:hypothetical protein
MTVDYDRFRFGAVNYPLPSSTANTLARDADPAIYWATQFFASVLRTYVGARIIAQATAAGAAIPDAVVTTWNVDPGPYLLDNIRRRFPLLALYRKDSQFNERTAVWEHEMARWECAYVLPPLNWDQAEKLVPILTAVARVLGHATRQGWDPAFMSGAKVWTPAFAGIETIGVTSGRYGRYTDAQGLIYHGWIGVIDAKEIVRAYTPDPFQALAGVDFHEDLMDGATNTTVTDEVVVDTSITPPPEGP